MIPSWLKVSGIVAAVLGFTRVAGAEVIWERPLTEEEKARYALDGGAGISQPEGRTYVDKDGKSLLKKDEMWPHCLAWVSGDHQLVYVEGFGKGVYDFLPVYGKAFPSSLPKDLKVDHTQWGREEFEIWLGRMKEGLTEKGDDDAHGRGLSEVCDVAEIPGIDGKRPYEDPSPQATYDAVEKWWRENRETVAWDPKIVAGGNRWRLGKLAAKK